MSTLPENEFDLEKLFLPAWAQEEPTSAKYAKYEVHESPADRRGDRRGPRPPRREGGPGGPGGRRDDNRSRGDRPRGPRPGGAGPRGPGRPGDRGGERFEPRREAPAPLPEINVALVPDEKGVESLARQIRMTGRAYPLFDIAQMILQKPERHSVLFSVKKNAEGKAVQPLFVCALDDTVWLSEDDAVGHVLRKHFATFYQTEKTPAEPPKGKYTFVAQCGLSGAILGPPNYHDYQNQLRRLHSERYSRMPFEAYKARVRIVKDEEVVKKWVEDQSWKTEYIALNLPEPLRLPNMEAVEKHFRETHRETIIKQVESHTVSGVAARSLRSPELTRLARSVWEDQRRFPLQIATALSQQFASHGLQFFKVNKTVTHVCVARPHYLDLAAAPVSEGVKRIVDYVNAHPKTTRKQLVEALAPSPVISAPIPVAAQVEGEAAPAQPDPNQPTPEQTAVVADLHWLVHQGHVIEFANGILETAKKPVPKPPRPEPKPAAAKAGEAVAQGEGSPAPEAVVAAEPAASPAEASASPAVPSGPSAPEAAPEAPVGAASESPAETPNAAPEPAAEAPVTTPAPQPEGQQ